MSTGVAGHVAPGYEPVRDKLEEHAGRLGAGGAAFAAYVDGELVADLWAGWARPSQAWERDTLAAGASVAKGLVGFCVHLLADRGLLDTEAPVAQYWPEFAQNGKSEVLVRHVLLHTAGVLWAPEIKDIVAWDGTGWDRWEEITAALAAAPPAWAPGTLHGYHAASYGWLAGELVRRVSGETVGTFFAREVAEPLGLDVYLGTPEPALGRVAHVYAERSAGFDALRDASRSPSTLCGQALLADGASNVLDHIDVLFNSPAFLRAVYPAGNVTATARDLARLFALLSLGGELDGVRLVSPDSIKRFSAEALREPDAVIASALPAGVEAPVASRSLGYLCNQGRFGPSPGAFGTEGLGGQLAFCDPERRVAAAFLRSDHADQRTVSTDLVETLFECLDRG